MWRGAGGWADDGDPAAVPIRVWHAILEGARHWTGYTHQWRRFPSFKTLCMASCDTPADRVEAATAGWRTFRTLSEGEDLAEGEISCPASAESGKLTTCDKCGLCDGTRYCRHTAAVRSIAIQIHGSLVHVANHRRRMVTLTIGATA